MVSGREGVQEGRCLGPATNVQGVDPKGSLGERGEGVGREGVLGGEPSEEAPLQIFSRRKGAQALFLGLLLKKSLFEAP